MVMEVTGVERQLTPEEQQVVGAEVQEPRVADTVLPRIEEPDKREAPLPTLPRAPLPSPVELQEETARQTLFGLPILVIDRYTGADANWVMLVRWDIPESLTGDLHEIALVSDNDAKTRYRIILANRDQNVPDKQASSPLIFTWRRGVLPGGTTVTVEVRSTDGTSIAVEGHITGTER